MVIFGYWGGLGLLEPLEGVKICATDTDDCVWTNDEGRAVVQIPIDQEFSLTWDKDGYQPLLLPHFQPQGLQLFPEIGMGREERFAGLPQLALSPYPMEGTGSLLVFPLDSRFSLISSGCAGVAGRTFELSNAQGKAFYYDEEGNWDANLAATSCWGWGGFTEVPPGEVQIEIGCNAKNCEAFYGWPGTVDNSVRMPVRAGYVTHVRVDCDVLQSSLPRKELSCALSTCCWPCSRCLPWRRWSGAVSKAKPEEPGARAA
jgi:hypothetical protein